LFYCVLSCFAQEYDTLRAVRSGEQQQAARRRTVDDQRRKFQSQYKLATAILRGDRTSGGSKKK